jgi:hypothetical protein
MRRLFASLAIFAATLAIYMANGETISSYDTVPNTVFAYNLIEHGALDFDRFRGTAIARLGGGYAFVEAPNAHLNSVFPIGTAFLTLPLYAALYVAAPPGDITAASFELRRQADEKRVAATVAAASAAMLFLCASLLGTALQAALATFVYALATGVWMTASQGLWQHGPVCLVTLVLIYALLRAERAAAPRARLAWLVLAGACAGFLPVIRPTALLFSAAGSAYAVAVFRRTSWPYWLAAAAAIAPGLAWNLGAFHTPSGGYAINLAAYDFTLPDIAVAFAGLLVSPSRGLFVFAPIVAFSVVGALRAARTGGAGARLVLWMALASCALLANYACTQIWQGGDCYGPRFLTDAMPAAALLLVYAVPSSVAGVCAFALLTAYSLGVQAVGAWGGAAGARWNGVPLEIARDPARVWQLRDSQIERNARATYYHIIPDYPARGAAYAAGFAGRVAAAGPGSAPLAGIRGGQIDLAATVQNTGTSPWYGYRSAVYNGEAQVRVRIRDAHGNPAGESVLYVAESPRPGESAHALGMIDLPRSPGTYTAALDMIAFGIASTAQRRDAPALHITFTIR